MVARAILETTPEVRVISALYFPLGCRDVQRAIAYVSDRIVNDDLVANLIRPEVSCDAEADITGVNKRLLSMRRSRNS